MRKSIAPSEKGSVTGQVMSLEAYWYKSNQTSYASQQSFTAVGTNQSTSPTPSANPRRTAHV